MTETLAQPPKPQKTRREKLKNFLFFFFVVEHLIIFLIVFILIFLLIRTYIFSPFSKLNQKAESFTPQSNELFYDSFIAQLKTQIQDGQTVEAGKFKFKFTEEELGNLLSSQNFGQIEKMFIWPTEGNHIFIWMKINDFPLPLMFDSSFEYREASGINIDLVDWTIGPINLPAELLIGIESRINDSINGYLNDASQSQGYTVTDVSTGEGEINIDAELIR